MGCLPLTSTNTLLEYYLVRRFNGKYNSESASLAFHLRYNNVSA